MKPEILILGAGVSGLVAALELEKRGYAPTILEQSDEVGGRVKTTIKKGCLLDHGFQVLLTAYPEARYYLDYEALNLHTFDPGAVVYSDGGWQKVTDPIRRPSSLFQMLFSGIGTLSDKIAIYKLQQRLKKTSPETIFNHEDRTTLAYLKSAGFSDKIISRFFRPFFSGIFLENGLETSSRMFEFVFKMFSEGYAAVPDKGMGEIPRQLSQKLKQSSIQFNTHVKTIGPTSILTSAGEYEFDRLIMTFQPGEIMENVAKGEYRKVHCLYFKTADLAFEDKMIMLNSGEGCINNMHYADVIAPSYVRDGHLLSVSVISNDTSDSVRREVEHELKTKFNSNVEFIDAFELEHALPVIESMAYTMDPKGTKIRDNVYLAGDHMLYPSLNAAMHSGRLAAMAVDSSFI